MVLDADAVRHLHSVPSLWATLSYPTGGGAKGVRRPSILTELPEAEVDQLGRGKNCSSRGESEQLAHLSGTYPRSPKTECMLSSISF